MTIRSAILSHHLYGLLSPVTQVEVIRNIITWYTRDGLGLKGIADRLNPLGISSPRGGAWSRYHGPDWSMTNIRDILLNPAYVGDGVWNCLPFAKFHKSADGKAVRRTGIPGGGTALNREDNWITIPDAHPALTTRKQFELTCAKRENRRSRMADNRTVLGRRPNPAIS